MRRGAVLALALLMLTGCGGAEPAHVTLVQVLAFDGPGPVTATGWRGQSDPCLTAVGAGGAEAQRALATLGTGRVELTHVGQVVLGPDAPAADILWQELRDRESGYGATVWLSQGPAGEWLTGCEDPPGRLEALERYSGIRAPTILEAAGELSRTGRVLLPVLALRDGQGYVIGWREVRGEIDFE